ncbi:MAG: XdhC family protein [Polyangiaceae bacterium]
MAELLDICRAARVAQERNEPCWVASVMRVKGSAYRHAGARLLFSSGQGLAGSVSGGCLEASIVRKGPWLTRERAVCVRYEGGREEGDDESEWGTGCDGAVDVLIERVDFGSRSEPLSFIEACLKAERRAVLLTVFRSENPGLPIGARVGLDELGNGMTSVRDPADCAALSWAAEGVLGETHPQSRLVHGECFDALLEIIAPAPHLFVFGSGPDAVPVVELAGTLGLGVTVCEPNPRVAVRERFRGRAELHLGSAEAALALIESRRTPLSVVMGHHYPTDREALAMLLRSGATYIGMLGPERRTRKMFGELFPNFVGPLPARVRAPIGLNLGAETPTQIALSIVAEIQAVLGQASAEPLSRCTARPIHALEAELTLHSAPTLLARTGTR